MPDDSHDAIAWTPDGRCVVFACDRWPSRGIWLIDLVHPNRPPIKVVGLGTYQNEAGARDE